MARKWKEAARRFEAQVVRVVWEAAADVVSDGWAALEEDETGVVRLVPKNPAACTLTVHADYPTLCMGPEGNCTEMFGSEQARLGELRQLVEAVIAGRYEWEHRQVTRRLLGLRLWQSTKLVGTFHTEDGPWVFSRQGAEPPGAVVHRTYEPYRPE